MFTHLIYGKSKNNMSIRFVLSNLIAKAVWTARSMSGANKKMIKALATRKKEEYLQQFKMNCHKFHFQSFHPIYALHINEFELCVWTGPQHLISLTRCTIKWIIMSKKAGGKYISNWHSIIAASFSSSSNLIGSMTLLHMAWKKKHRRVMANLTLFVKMSSIATVNNCCINTW